MVQRPIRFRQAPARRHRPGLIALLALPLLALLLWQVASQEQLNRRANAASDIAATDTVTVTRPVTAIRAPLYEEALADAAGASATPDSGHAVLSSSNDQQRLLAPIDHLPWATTPPTGQGAAAADELPIFAALRSSRNQPIPTEVAELAAELTKDATNDLQRARALYDWLTANIRYDTVEWNHITGGGSSYTHEHDPASVLARGTTVCAGYSWLFDALARSVGLASNFLIGDVRGYRGTADDDLISAFKHAWNAVMIDGNWELLDATWGARQVDETLDSGYLARRDYYFATPPNQMIFDHLPESADWQLLADPLPDSDAFQRLPNLKPTFFQHGLRLGNGQAANLTTSAATGGTLLLSAPEAVAIGATLSRPGDATPPLTIPVLEAGTERAIHTGPLPAGDYLLRLYSKAPDDATYTCSADFMIHARQD